MTMPAFLLLLVKLNLVMAAAVTIVWLLRRPLRLWFGAPIAYAVWFLVPVAAAASLLPPRIAAPVLVRIAPVHLPVAAGPVMDIGHSVSRIAEQLTAKAVPMTGTAWLIFAAWALGTVLTALYLTRLQLRFSGAVRRGEAGPAVVGFWRPRIVMPNSFQECFTPREQAAILAHERVHMARQDARINALTACLQCLCWFNPLIHLGARWLRIDQELACDASAVAGTVSRRDYAKALLKSQMIATALPLGCNWPGSQHPLVERVALLQRKPLGPTRRLAGASLVILAAVFGGLGAWAAQPPIAARSVAAQQFAHGNPPLSGNVNRPTAKVLSIAAGTEAVPAAVHQTSNTPLVAGDQPATTHEGSDAVSCSAAPVLQGSPANRRVVVCRVNQVNVIEKHVIVNNFGGGRL